MLEVFEQCLFTLCYTCMHDQEGKLENKYDFNLLVCLLLIMTSVGSKFIFVVLDLRCFDRLLKSDCQVYMLVLQGA